MESTKVILLHLNNIQEEFNSQPYFIKVLPFAYRKYGLSGKKNKGAMAAAVMVIIMMLILTYERKGPADSIITTPREHMKCSIVPMLPRIWV